MAYLLTIPGELSSYLNIAYSLRYKYQPINEDFFTRIITSTKRMFTLIKELVWDNTSEDRLQKNVTQLKTDFENKNKSYSGDEKPLCVYFVNDETIQNNNLKTSSYYYHHYKIQELEKHFTVVPELFSSQDQMKTAMEDLQTKYSNKKIQFINIYTHSNKSTLITSAMENEITTKNVNKDLFAACAPDATILLDGSYTGSGTTNIADEIARKNPGRTILAPNSATYFSKPIIEGTETQPKVVSTIDPFAIFNPHKYKFFLYTEEKDSNYPYPDWDYLIRDLYVLEDRLLLMNPSLDQFLKPCELKERLREEVIFAFSNISPEFQKLILKKISIFKNLDNSKFQEFLSNNPLHPKVLSAFRSVIDETFYELRDIPYVRFMKMSRVAVSTTLFVMANLYTFYRDITSLSNTLFMIPREIPNYLKTAYSIRYENQPNIGNSLEQIVNATKRMFTLIQEINYPTDQNRFTEEQLGDKFTLINKSNNQSTNQKPLCVYFVENSDQFEPKIYYYHLYKIQELQKHFTVAPSLVSSQEEISDFMKTLPDQPIQFVNIASSGEKSKLLRDDTNNQSIHINTLKENLFEKTAPDATILLEGPCTGLGTQNIASHIANNTLERRVLAPATMGYSKPIIETTEEGPKVVSAVYGNTMLNAKRCKPFRYTKTRSLEYPYPLVKHMLQDLKTLAYNPLIRNHWLDPFMNQNESKKALKAVVPQLSNETQALILKKHNESFEPAKTIDAIFDNDQNPSEIISILREVVQELEEELCELPGFNRYKLTNIVMNVKELAEAYFHTLTKKQST